MFKVEPGVAMVIALLVVGVIVLYVMAYGYSREKK